MFHSLFLGKNYFFVFIVLLCLSLSGCALIKLPFDILGKLLGIASKVPKPPPGVFF
ncbi:MAG TPA: hypothetical protein PLH56_07015 [Candidatus Omnitrophota bacterium]|nr:hypothetical protein [Candidatus Omnitrophota bacterium]HPN89069.1 hypothetical protein [Candidatus Omnitrophota bacterium]